MTTTTTATPHATNTPRRSSARVRRAPAKAAAYFALSLVGGLLTWYYNLAYIAGGGANYLGDWFANAASASAAVDIVVVCVAASVFYLREGNRLGWRRPAAVLFIPSSILGAVAFAFPLFLGLRELSLARTSRRDPHSTAPAPAA